MDAEWKPYVEAIRNNKLIGKGTCSSIDECWSDDEIIMHISNIDSPEKAVAEMMEVEEAHLSQALDCRWGEDSDPELKAWEEWKRNEKKYNKK